MQAVVSMRLHTLIFAAGHGIPLVGIVYDPKVSAFLRYIGQNLFIDLDKLNEKDLCSMIDAAVEQGKSPEAQAEAVDKLLATEKKNLETAKELLAH